MNKSKLLAFCSFAVLAIISSSVHAQVAEDSTGATGTDSPSTEEIVVTARKRSETLLNVPVAVTAVQGDTLERRGMVSVDALTTLVPQLIMGEGGSTVQGGVIALRGISGADANTFADQAVSFNVDGVAIARTSVRRLAEMDIAQIEVLKGPQALYYGKNSPGGVINIKTADPTDILSGKISGGYEFNAKEWRGDGFVAGPLTDTLGFRVAAYGSTMKGWLKSIVPTSSLLQPSHKTAPYVDEWAVRGTLKWDPVDRFSARLKLTYNKRSGDSSSAANQFINCPLGAPQASPADDCRANGTVLGANPGPGFSQYEPGVDADGENFLRIKQSLSSLELNYDLSDEIRITSVSGYYYNRSRNFNDAAEAYISARQLPSYTDFGLKELSQETRITSSFSGPFNFTLGGYYQRSNASYKLHVFNGTPQNLLSGGLPGPQDRSESFIRQKGEAYSFFLSGNLKILPTVELSGGGRYSHETKNIPELLVDLTPNTAGGGALSRTTSATPVTPLVSKRSFNNFSPEVTLSWRPNDRLNVYGSYKKGFLSGGFNAGAAERGHLDDITYEQQLVQGFEAGVKANMLDGKLRTNLAAYTYEITGLQVSLLVNNFQELRNAGTVRSKGIEFDFDYRTPLPGLRLHGALAYGDGKYTDYQGICYRGQTANSTPPCVNQVNRFSGKTGLLQDLSGTELIRNPEWTGNFGLDYSTPLSSGVKLSLSGDMNYSSSYLTDASSKAAGRQPAYALLDASVRVADTDNRWEVTLIGRNLTQQWYWVRNSDNPGSGTAAGVEPAVLGDSKGAISRGREIMLRLTYRFGH